jgi:hypothetical protein
VLCFGSVESLAQPQSWTPFLQQFIYTFIFIYIFLTLCRHVSTVCFIRGAGTITSTVENRWQHSTSAELRLPAQETSTIFSSAAGCLPTQRLNGALFLYMKLNLHEVCNINKGARFLLHSLIKSNNSPARFHQAGAPLSFPPLRRHLNYFQKR